MWSVRSQAIVVNCGWLQSLYSLLYELSRGEKAVKNFP